MIDSQIQQVNYQAKHKDVIELVNDALELEQKGAVASADFVKLAVKGFYVISILMSLLFIATIISKGLVK